MSQAEAIRREPNLKRYTHEEIHAMIHAACECLRTGDVKKAEKLILEVPLLPKSAKIMKRMCGIDEMISSGVNLSEAVEEYGYDWLSEK